VHKNVFIYVETISGGLLRKDKNMGIWKLKNKKVVKAMTIGLAAVLAEGTVIPGTTMQVFAQTENDEDLVTKAEVKSENEDAVIEAKGLTEAAAGLEDGVAKEVNNGKASTSDLTTAVGNFAWNAAIEEVGKDERNDSNSDDSAYEYENNAKNHLADAANALEDADKKLSGDESATDDSKKKGYLDTFEERIKNLKMQHQMLILQLQRHLLSC